MNTIEAKGSWKEQKKKLKQKFALLTDNELLIAESEKEELFNKLQARLGKTKEELHRIIASL
jgi:uncharacterized protein YjbJ (UPF0337 family)